MKKLILPLVAGLLLTGAGCRSLMQGVAEEPYLKAMQNGRMPPSAYQQKREELRQASEPAK